MENNNKELRIPTGRRRTGWLFTRVAEDLISGHYREQIQTVGAGLKLRTFPEVQLSNRKALPLLKFVWRT